MKISLNISALRLRESLPIIAAFVFLQFSTPIFAAETSAAAEQELEAVREAIESIQSWLAVAENTQSDEINKLQQADLEISNLSQSVTAIETTIVTTGAEIEQLSQQSDKLAQLKQEQSALLQQAIRTAYMAGNQSAIELLLNQEDISKSARLLHYHRLFTEAQLNSMT